MDQLLGHSITYRIAVEPQQGRKVFTLQTLPARDDSFGNEAEQGGRADPGGQVPIEFRRLRTFEGLVNRLVPQATVARQLLLIPPDQVTGFAQVVSRQNLGHALG